MKDAVTEYFQALFNLLRRTRTVNVLYRRPSSPLSVRMWRHDERWPLDWMLKSPAVARRRPAIGHWKSSPFTLCTVWLKTTTWKLRPHAHFLSRNLNMSPSRRLQIYSRTLISCAFGCKLLTCTNTTTRCVWRADIRRSDVTELVVTWRRRSRCMAPVCFWVDEFYFMLYDIYVFSFPRVWLYIYLHVWFSFTPIELYTT